MGLRINQSRAGKIAPRAALASALLAAAVLTVQSHGTQVSQAARPHDLQLTADKADYRGNDYANTGRVSNLAVPITPSQVFWALPSAAQAQGVLADNLHHIIFYANKSIYGYTQGTTALPNGSAVTPATPLWSAPIGESLGSVTAYPPQFISIGSDNNAYVATDVGNLYTVPTTGSGVQTPVLLFNSSTGFSTTPKLQGSNVYVGSQGGFFYSVTNVGVQNWQFDPTNPANLGGTTAANSPARFNGEAALGNAGATPAVFVTVQDNTGGSFSGGKVYALNAATGVAIWEHSLPLATTGAALLSGTTLIVPDKGHLTALNAATGAQIWQASAAVGENFLGSPALSLSGTDVYFASNVNLYAWNVSTGAPDLAFNTTGKVPGIFAQTSPIVDGAGNIVIRPRIPRSRSSPTARPAPSSGAWPAA